MQTQKTSSININILAQISDFLNPTEIITNVLNINKEFRHIALDYISAKIDLNKLLECKVYRSK